MSKIIEISVTDKIAATEFTEVVSLNDNYRLRFHFDEEWKNYVDRVAVVSWENGSAEQLFQGEECDMPMVNSITSEVVKVGVYSILKGKRLSSSLVTLRCTAGACAKPGAKRVDSLHEQILDYLNQHEGGFAGNMEAGTLHVGSKSYDGSEDVTVSGADLGLAKVALTGNYNDLDVKPAAAPVTSVNGHTGDVRITKYDLGLSALALSGAWEDLKNKPASIVTSVNGKAGVVSKSDLGLAQVAITGSWTDLKNTPSFAQVALSGSYNDLTDKPSVTGMPFYTVVVDGADANRITEKGFYHLRGSADLPLRNVPTSANNSPSDGLWCLLIIPQIEDNVVVQIAISEKADRAISIRSRLSGSWTAWLSIV